MEDFDKMKEIKQELNNSKVNKMELRSVENKLIRLYQIEEEY